ncbi:hypothetical protein ACFXTN_002161 [Malus domestica]
MFSLILTHQCFLSLKNSVSDPSGLLSGWNGGLSSGHCSWTGSPWPDPTPSSRPTPGSEWSTAQASVMEIRILVEALQLSAHQNLTTQLVVAHVQELEIQLGRLHWDTPVDLIVFDIQRGQACQKLHL